MQSARRRAARRNVQRERPMNDREAKEVLRRAAHARGIPLGPRALQLVQAVARLETRYGTGWGGTCKGAGVGSHNWGAIQGPGFACVDTHEDGTPYLTSFRAYPSPESGAAALVTQLWSMRRVRRVLQEDSIDVVGMATAMRRSGYYEAPLERYVTAMRNNLRELRAAAW